MQQMGHREHGKLCNERDAKSISRSTQYFIYSVKHTILYWRISNVRYPIFHSPDVLTLPA